MKQPQHLNSSKRASFRWPHETVECWRIRQIMDFAFHRMDAHRWGIRHQWEDDGNHLALEVTGDISGGFREQIDRWVVTALDAAIIDPQVDHLEFVGIRR